MIKDVMTTKTSYRKGVCEYRNPELSIDRRVADLLQRMTIEEKVAQMLCIWEQKNAILFDTKGMLSCLIQRVCLILKKSDISF